MFGVQRMAAAARSMAAVVGLAALAGCGSAGAVAVGTVAASSDPVPVITGHPPNPATSTKAVFTYTDSLPDVTFKCSLDGSQFSFCPPGQMTYPKLGLGDHVFRVEAGIGFMFSSTATYSWRIIPPAPVIIVRPHDPSQDRNPEFIFTDADWPNVRFLCHLDNHPVMNCTGDTDFDWNQFTEGEWQFRHLAPGPHCFYVQAIASQFGVGGVPSMVTTFCWTISGPLLNFTVGGDLTEPLLPGTSESLNMTFTNPNPVPITIAKGAVTAANITITTDKPGCASSNFAVTQGLLVAVTIPANQLTPVSLAALGVPQADWPVISMLETNTNQDACQGAKLTLTFSNIQATGP